MIIVYDLYFAVELGSVFAAIVMQQIEAAAAFGMVEISAANIEEKTGIKKVDVLEAAKLLEVRGFVSILKNGNIAKKQITKKTRGMTLIKILTSDFRADYAVSSQQIVQKKLNSRVGCVLHTN